MKNKKGFTLIELLVVISIIGVLALMGLRVYGGQKEKAKNAMVKANAGTVQTLIQAELADTTDLDREEAVDIAKAAGLHNPFNNAPMKNAGDFPGEDKSLASAKTSKTKITLSEAKVLSVQGQGSKKDTNISPGKIKITLSDDGVFSIQGCGADGLLPDILTARR